MASNMIQLHVLYPNAPHLLATRKLKSVTIANQQSVVSQYTTRDNKNKQFPAREVLNTDLTLKVSYKK